MVTDAVPTDRRRQRHEAKRAAIVAAAWDLARRDGLAVISLRDLADRVDLRQPSLYAYFESKLDLYDAMFADANRQLLETVAEHEFTGSGPAALAEFVASLVRFASDDVVRHQLLFQRTIPGFEPSPESYALALQFYEVARDRAAAAGITDQADLDVFSALVSGFAHQQVANDPGGDRWVRLAGRAVELLLITVERRRTSTTGRDPR